MWSFPSNVWREKRREHLASVFTLWSVLLLVPHCSCVLWLVNGLSNGAVYTKRCEVEFPRLQHIQHRPVVYFRNRCLETRERRKATASWKVFRQKAHFFLHLSFDSVFRLTCCIDKTICSALSREASSLLSRTVIKLACTVLASRQLTRMLLAICMTTAKTNISFPQPIEVGIIR